MLGIKHLSMILYITLQTFGVFTLPVNKIPWGHLNMEWWRLLTFSNYPRGGSLSCIILARQGFVYIGNGDTNDDSVLCVFCLSSANDLDDDSDIEELHHSLNSNCPIVRGVNCGNTLIENYDSRLNASIFCRLPFPQTNEASSQDSNTAQHYEGQVLPMVVDGPAVEQADEPVNVPYYISYYQTTIDHVPHVAYSQASENDTSPVYVTNHAQSLCFAASADEPSGHFITEPSSMAAASVCARCARPIGVHPSGVSSSDRNDNCSASSNPHIMSAPQINIETSNAIGSQESHQIVTSNSQASPNTRGVSLDAQVAMDSCRAPQNEDATQQENDRLGIITVRPKRREYAVEVTRLKSFEGWPADHHVKPEDLAEAGFFYAGYSDCARCFFCGGGLRNWETDDNGWVEHARWFPKCAYMRQRVGQAFIDVVQDLNKLELKITYDYVVNEMKSRDLEHSIPKDIKNKSSDLERDAAVKTVVEYGFCMKDVIEAAKTVKNNGYSLAADKIFEELLKTNTLTFSEPVRAHNNSQSTSDIETERRKRETIESLKRENEQLRQQSQCRICMDSEVAVIFLPCGHLISCRECSYALKKCPECQQNIKGVIFAYLS